MSRIPVSAVAVLIIGLSSMATAAPLPSCVSLIAEQYEVPKHIFEAMALVQMDQPNKQTGLGRVYGPMGLSLSTLKTASQGIKSNPGNVAGDACMNYRAAAWWLMNKSRKKTDTDIWEAVNRFYYGDREQGQYTLTYQVAEAYEVLSSPAAIEAHTHKDLQAPHETVARCMAKVTGLAAQKAGEDKLTVVGMADSTYSSEPPGVVSCSASFRTLDSQSASRLTSTFSTQVTE